MPDWPSLDLHSYIATDLGLDNNLELRTVALSISSVSVCATGLTAMGPKKRVLHRVPRWAIPQYLNMTFNKKLKVHMNSSRSHRYRLGTVIPGLNLNHGYRLGTVIPGLNPNHGYRLGTVTPYERDKPWLFTRIQSSVRYQFCVPYCL